MGQAFDRDGNVLGAAEADTAAEVLRDLQLAHPHAAAFSIEMRKEQAMRDKIEEIEKKAIQKEDRMLQFFTHSHLPEHLAKVSLPFCQLAEEIVATLPPNPERTVALRKLLEAKDCAVRALLYK